MSERICIAQIGGAHGIRGEVKLKSFTADPMAVKDYGVLEREEHLVVHPADSKG